MDGIVYAESKKTIELLFLLKYPSLSVARTQAQWWLIVVKEGVLHVGWTARKSWVVQGPAVVEANQFCAQHVLDVRFSFAPFTKQTQNWDQATTQR